MKMTSAAGKFRISREARQRNSDTSWRTRQRSKLDNTQAFECEGVFSNLKTQLRTCFHGRCGEWGGPAQTTVAIHPLGEGEFSFAAAGRRVPLLVTNDALTPFDGLVP